MPLEGHWNRLENPLSRRDKRLLRVFLCVAVLAIGGGAYAYVDRSPAPSNAGCVVVTVPSTMGGATLRNCGAAARRFCRIEGRRSQRIAQECRREGYTTGPATG